MAELRTEPVVVIGLGRFGTALALELANRGTEVLGIDHRPKAVQALSGQLPHVITADSTDIEALRQLGVAEFHRAVVAIGTDIQASILTTSLLSELGIPDIWAKAISAQHSNILTRVGAHHVVAPEHDMGERVAHLLSGRILDYAAAQNGWWSLAAGGPGFPRVEGPCASDEATDGDDRVGVEECVDNPLGSFGAALQSVERVVPAVRALDVPALVCLGTPCRPCGRSRRSGHVRPAGHGWLLSRTRFARNRIRL